MKGRYMRSDLNADLFQPLRPLRVSEAISQSIRSVILKKQLNPGDRIPSERALAEKFQVGRLTVREAFRGLEERGLIKIKKGGAGGAFVADAVSGREDIASIVTDNLDLEGISEDEMGEVRHMLAENVIRLVTKRVETEEQVMRVALDRLEAHVDTYKLSDDLNDSRKLLSASNEFNIMVARLSGNVPLTLFTHVIIEWTRRKLRYFFPTMKEQKHILQKDRMLINKIRKKDLTGSLQIMKEVIGATNKRIVAFEMKSK